MSSRFTEKDHEHAFKLWRQGKSLREISESDPRLPSREMLSRWKNGDVKCDCKWHNWEDLHSQPGRCSVGLNRFYGGKVRNELYIKRQNGS